ncbi:MAG: hydroxylamine oxidoreductase [Magnetococcales bacterium]|nr:hydroxylamine oxidoreductase [Magnetococcales bacterium]
MWTRPSPTLAPSRPRRVGFDGDEFRCMLLAIVPFLIAAGWLWPVSVCAGQENRLQRGDAISADREPRIDSRPQDRKVIGTFKGEECLECHATLTPGIVKDWRQSRHARGENPVDCSACHGHDHQRLRLPAPAICGQCHPRPVAQMEEEKRYGFPSHALALERLTDSSAFAEKPKAEVAACLHCHSVAQRCDSCHTRHRFAAAEARRPEACITCHTGPPHPDDQSYFSSPHGLFYLREGKKWDWNRPLRRGNYPAPGCAGCHMTNGRHLIADKSLWKSGIREINPRTAENTIKRKRWSAICKECHPSPIAEDFFLSLDEERGSAWKKLYAVEDQLKALRRHGWLLPKATDRPHFSTDPWGQWFPRVRIGDLEGMESAFYNVSAVERDYFEMWYFANPGAYKGMAHGARKMSSGCHDLMIDTSRTIATQTERLKLLGKMVKDVDLKRVWMDGEYTRFNRDNH